MLWIFGLVGLAIIVVIGLVVVGRETARLAAAPRSAIYDMAEAVDFIADRLPPDSQARLTHADVRWVLMADADLLEAASLASAPADIDEPPDKAPTDDLALDPLDPSETVDPISAVTRRASTGDEHEVDEAAAIARVLALADASGRELADEDVAAVLDIRLEYLRAIGAIGPQA